MAVKMLSLAISEATVGLSLSIYCWKALPGKNRNMLIYFSKQFAVVKSQEDEKYALLSQVTGCQENFTADNIQIEKLKTENIFKLALF